MRKFIYIFATFVTLYMAGMYRSQSLMVLGSVEIALFVYSFFLTLYFRRKLSAEVLRHSEAVIKSAQFSCYVRVKNTGMLPISRFKIKLKYGYVRIGNVKYIYGGSGRGENILHFEVSGQFCGMMILRMTRLRVYDYFSLFSAVKRMEEEVRIAVFPQEKAIHLELSSLGCRGIDLPQDRQAAVGSDATNEIRQLREYRLGDSSRYIHWNQSARMEQLWVKEYEKETDYSIELLLDLEGIEDAGAEELDSFYEILAALIMGFLQQSAMVRVHWYDGNSRLADMEAASSAQCRDVLFALYEMDYWETFNEKNNKIQKQQLENEFVSQGNYFKLDLGLGWYWNERLIFRFSPEELDEQICRRFFVLSPAGVFEKA